MAFLKIFLIPDFRGLVVQKRYVFSLLAFTPKWLLRISLLFCMSSENNRLHRLSQMDFPRKFLIQDYRGLSDQKRSFLLFWPFLENSSKEYPNFFHEDNRVHHLNEMAFLKIFLISDFRRLSFQKGVFSFLLFL